MYKRQSYRLSTTYALRVASADKILLCVNTVITVITLLEALGKLLTSVYIPSTSVEEGCNRKTGLGVCAAGAVPVEV